MSRSVVDPRSALQWRADQAVRPIERIAPQEIAVGLSLDGRPHTVLMATPDDLEDLARGFVVTEAVAAAKDIAVIDIRTEEQGVLVDVRFRPGGGPRKARPRNLEGRSSCGLCGVERLADAVRPLPVLAASDTVLAHAVIPSALERLEVEQELGRLTRATHAAAFFSPDGDLVLLREDVGRHNALDKLAGGLLREGRDPAAGFVVVTSRSSFEMVEKTVRLGCPILVAVSAPTALAIDRAQAANLTLVALARADGHAVFAGAERLTDRMMEPA